LRLNHGSLKTNCMKIKLSLTAPEYAPLIVNYDDWFHEDHAYALEWNYPVLPGHGQFIAFSFISDLIKDHIDIIKLPVNWEVVNVIWNKEGSEVIPTLFVVGK